MSNEESPDCTHEQAEEQGIRDDVLYLLCPCGEEIARPLSPRIPVEERGYGTVTLKLTLKVHLPKAYTEYSDEGFEAFLDDLCGDVTMFHPSADVTVHGVKVSTE